MTRLHNCCIILSSLPLALPAVAATGAESDGAALYPAVVIEKATLAYSGDGRGGIARCRAIVSAGSVRRDREACDTLRSRGTPKEVIPAMPIGEGAVVQPADYPELSVKRGESGTTETIVEIDEAGKVSGCWVSYSSGSPRLDQQSCNLMLTRSRYSPATYKGKPVRAVGVRDVVWAKPVAR
ncbi:energy transducer TonB [Sphingomonas sp. DBB INV C78]|uniref:energy transducer TonB n=1 Tax=Sphingomonas sp. DBB INV C78 TaxID=3349434 RepID=UPI0036D3E4FF